MTLNEVKNFCADLNIVNPYAYEAYFDGDSFQVRVVSHIGHFADDILNELYAWFREDELYKIGYIGPTVDDKPMLIINL